MNTNIMFKAYNLFPTDSYHFTLKYSNSWLCLGQSLEIHMDHQLSVHTCLSTSAISIYVELARTKTILNQMSWKEDIWIVSRTTGEGQLVKYKLKSMDMLALAYEQLNKYCMNWSFYVDKVMKKSQSIFGVCTNVESCKSQRLQKKIQNNF